MFSLIGVLFAGVGIFPVDEFFTAHNVAASGMTAVFVSMVIGPRGFVPAMSRVFLLLGYVFVAVIGVMAVPFVTGYYTLTAVELVVFLHPKCGNTAAAQQRCWGRRSGSNRPTDRGEPPGKRRRCHVCDGRTEAEKRMASAGAAEAGATIPLRAKAALMPPARLERPEAEPCDVLISDSPPVRDSPVEFAADGPVGVHGDTSPHPCSGRLARDRDCRYPPIGG
ncbi:hypothetical protein [Cryobacterium tagatosivorans]|uniref:Uncharacterized protein n=1 Tax=Cryobacterium tagatosivorans TaxID=1259199 RepID=A0A4R8UB86_9MICO|nr:hypothetical protein [Cryobacterium tagatosivorans]TFB47825.1 hypothetical protein E3O23_14560 [Cryobacterium tagatosivorans]